MFALFVCVQKEVYHVQLQQEWWYMILTQVNMSYEYRHSTSIVNRDYVTSADFV